MNLAVARADELGIHKPNAKKKPSELYIPYNSTSSTTSSMDSDDHYLSITKKNTPEDDPIQRQEIEQTTVQLDLGSSAAAL